MHDNVKAVIEALRAVYVNHAAGCCWHILSDDGNVDDGHLQFCVAEARKHEHPACLAVIEPMSKLSRTQRESLSLKHYDEYGA